MMTKKQIKERAWLSDPFLKGEIKGVVLSFQGLGAGYRSEEAADPIDLAISASGGLMVLPYYGPWSWMNRQARSFTDEIVEAVYKAYDLPKSLPLISTGLSMGGCASLLFCRYSKHHPTACLALFPVCDTEFHFAERPDLPPTFHYAFRGYPESLEENLKEHSPLAQVKGMPDIPYLIIHGDKDKAVNKERHSDKFVAAMRAQGRRIEYLEVPGMGHGFNTPLSVMQKQYEFVRSFLKS